MFVSSPCRPTLVVQLKQYVPGVSKIILERSQTFYMQSVHRIIASINASLVSGSYRRFKIKKRAKCQLCIVDISKIKKINKVT